jgi:hypothetical protein
MNWPDITFKPDLNTAQYNRFCPFAANDRDTGWPQKSRQRVRYIFLLACKWFSRLLFYRH